MKLSELLKDKSTVIESIEKQQIYSEHIVGGLFRKDKDIVYTKRYFGYAIVQNGKKLLETFGICRDQDGETYRVNPWLIINGQKQSGDKETFNSIFNEIEHLYYKQEEEKQRIGAEKQKAVLEQKKQVYYNLLQKNLLVK